MAGVVTLIDEVDDIDLTTGFHFIRREFQYTREIGDDEAILVTPTTGDETNQKKGFIEAPWAGVVSVGASNIGVTTNTPIAPFLNVSLILGPDDISGVSDGMVIDLLTGEDRNWPVTFNGGDDEQVRCFPVGSQAAGGRTYWLGFVSENAKAADWLLTIQLMEVA